MSIVALGLNLLLAGLLAAALAMGWRLNRRLAALRESQAGFGKAVAELNAAAARAEQGLAELRAATDAASDELGDRIERARALAGRLERLMDKAPAAAAPRQGEAARAEEGERRLGDLLAAAREARARAAPERPARREPLVLRTRVAPEDDLFEAPVESGPISAMRGLRR